jgi:hypothetical protein
VILRLVVAAALLAIAVIVAWRLRAQPTAEPVNPPGEIPRQLHRADFARPDVPWLVVLFASATCDGCATVAAKVAVLESAEVAVEIAEFPSARVLHERYAIESVPLVVVVDGDGVTRGAFLGPTSATDLWAAVAEVRRPGSTPEPDLGKLG